MDTFKYFAKIEKAYQDGKDWYVQGIASGTELDRDGERMAKSVLEQFANAMPMSLTNAHPRSGEVGGDFGEIVEAQVTPDDKLFVKAKLDSDNPLVPYMMKQIAKGKRHAFSIEGYVKKAETKYDQKLARMVTEYQDVRPRAISITTEPSYMPSFLEVVSKSYDKDKTISDNTILKSNETTMDEDKKVVTETEQVTEPVTETVSEVATEVKPAVEEVKPEESKAEEVKVEPKEEVAEEVTKSVGDMVDDEAEEEAEDEELKETIVEKVEEAIDKAQEEREEEEEQAEIMACIQSMSAKLDGVMVVLEQLVQSDKAVHEQVESTQKSVRVLKRVVKSIHEDNELIKDLPLMKKSKVVSRTLDEVPEAPKRFGVKAVENLVQ